MADEIKQDRRRFLGAAATTIAAQLGMVGPADAQAGKTDAEDKAAIRPFRVKVSEESLNRGRAIRRRSIGQCVSVPYGVAPGARRARLSCVLLGAKSPTG
jgi:hypothetical protein